MIDQIAASPSVEAAAGAGPTVTITASQAGTYHLSRLLPFATKYGAGADDFVAAGDLYVGHRFPFGIKSIKVKGVEHNKSASSLPSNAFAPWRGVMNKLRLPSVFLGSDETIDITLEVPAGSPRLLASFAVPFTPSAGKCDVSANLFPGGVLPPGYAMSGKSLALASDTPVTVQITPIIEGNTDLSRLCLQATTGPVGAGDQQELDVSELMIVTGYREQAGNELIKGKGAVRLPNLWASSTTKLWANLGQQFISAKNTIEVDVYNPLSQPVDIFACLPLVPVGGGGIGICS